MITTWALGAVLGMVGGPADGSAGPDLAAYESARASAGRDAEAQVRLALWCEARGMAAERTTHLMRAVLVDPENARARGLLGQVKHEGRWLRPADVAKAVEESPERQALLREYLDRRAKTRDKADDLYRLALWCEDRGLTQAMVAHLHRVVQLDPGREGAWRRLGYKKVSGRWIKPEIQAAAKAERETQARADQAWRARLAAIKAGLASRDGAKRAEALAALQAIDDPRAVRTLWVAFAEAGDERGQATAVEAFARIEGPGASLGLATLAVFSPHAGIRQEASRRLVGRDPRDFGGFLASLVSDEIKYKVKTIDGPGSQGELLIMGPESNVRRIYSSLEAPPPPITVSLDHGGYRSIRVPLGPTTTLASYNGASLAAQLAEAERSKVDGTPPVSRTLHAAGLSTELSQMVAEAAMPGSTNFSPGRVALLPQSSPLPVYGQDAPTLAPAGLTPGQALVESGRMIPTAVGFAETISIADLTKELTRDPSPANIQKLGGPNFRPILDSGLTIPVDLMIEHARNSVYVSRQQMADDVAWIEAANEPVRTLNERATTILKTVSGQDYGYDPRKWRDWVFDVNGYGVPWRSPEPEVPTFIEEVPLAYNPTIFFPVETGAILGFTKAGPSCFAGGTPVRTLRGDRPIEAIRAGDLVLSQDTTTGKLAYQPVVQVMHNPPNTTYKIDLGRETVHPTGIHRFWKAGRGWIMAREVKAGDRLRTVGGTVEVVSVEKEPVQPVFNLLLSGGDNFCVGSIGLIAHDNGFVEPVARPFDGVPATTDLAATAKP
ncbi:polymorphic toxin-type HINT domain-containing protein [Paludisphaera mucosa]|uniref:Polymorphic toxin-type HINT domain-containing protein n=1 Tax=Paludisphaera mucosa TaxID=3030827 RepID=A0ABT6FJQ0_9BACT|nr:polymorphic toxin-type HINT domain-containing protein [Paludisphaera mucosa]MDG3007808.1 polymorphic toxin-type HINT domain-containing protein [Paludisphaera mucosa]